MKTLLITCWSIFFISSAVGQNFQGAWETVFQNDSGESVQHVTIFSDGFFSEAFFDEETGSFQGTWGGSYEINDGIINYSYEFATNNPEWVGTTQNTPFEFRGGQLHIADTIWSRVDDGSPGKLAGAWLISGRMRNGEMREMDTTRPRKTMKILSGTRFQWIAYNIETKEFMGTGGGTYTTLNGKYTENIEFFSRDDSRVGARLEFNFELQNGDWHHSGKSSKGDPIHEIWSKRVF